MGRDWVGFDLGFELKLVGPLLGWVQFKFKEFELDLVVKGLGLVVGRG